MKNFFYGFHAPHEVKHNRKSESQPTRLNPLTLFLLIFLTYNLLGLIDSPWTRTGAYDKTLGWNLFFTGLSGFGLALLMSGRYVVSSAGAKHRPRTSKQLSVLFFALFVICLATTVMFSGGIPLFQGEQRFGNSALAFNLAQLYGFWVLVRTISDSEDTKKINWLAPVVYLLGALCFGYRTPVLIFGIVLLVYFVTFRVSAKSAIVLGFAFGTFIVGFSALFAGYRVSQNYDLLTFFKNIDFRYITEHPYLMPFVPALAMFDFSQYTIYSIGAGLHDYMYGGLFLSNYETFLPGKHWGARNIIGDITSARWVAGRPMSITPTLQGAFFVDFGYPGVFAGFAAIGFGISRLWRLSRGWGALGKFSFSYLLTLCIMGIHNGYWDVGFVFFLLFLLIIYLFDALKRSLASSMEMQRFR